MKRFLAGLMAFVLATSVTSTITFADKYQTVGEQGTIPGATREITDFDGSFFSVTGYASVNSAVNDRTQYIGTEYYRTVANEIEFLQAITDAGEGKVKVIEITEDLNLGWHEIGEEGQAFSCISAFTNSLIDTARPVSNPILLNSGVSEILFKNIDGLTIFSLNGNTIRHTNWKLSASCNDIIVRNIEFDEMYEWDDWQNNGIGGKGNRKRNGWSYFKVNGATNVWVDHCTFGMAFDGMFDVEGGSSGVTLSWSECGKKDYSKDGMYYKTMMYMESLYQDELAGTGDSFVIYKIMRDNGLSMEQILQFFTYHAKCHLVGSGDKDVEDNAKLRFTMAYNHYVNCGQRLPRLRGGSSQLFNCYIDNTEHRQITAIIDGTNIEKQISDAGGSMVTLSRAINTAMGGSTSCDTTVFEGVCTAMIGVNHKTHTTGGDAITVNSSFEYTNFNADGSVKNVDYYEGGSWDNGGKNFFTHYNDGTFYFTPDENGNNLLEFFYNDEGAVLPYEYKVFPLSDVKETVTTYSGCGTIAMTAEDWLKTEYPADYAVNVIDSSNIAVTGITLDLNETGLAVGNYHQLNAFVVPKNAANENIIWTSSDESIATVTDSGLLKGIKPGQVTITAESEDGGFKQECKLTVFTPLEEIKLPKSQKIYLDDVVKLDIEFTPNDAAYGTLEWTSSKPEVATVDPDGTIHAVSPGRTTISVVSDHYGIWVKETCVITVLDEYKPVDTLTKNPGDVDLDEKVNASDALMVLKCAAKMITLDEQQTLNADVTNDEKIDATDALKILQYAAQIIPSLD